jgi:hypothetical protein
VLCCVGGPSGAAAAADPQPEPEPAVQEGAAEVS